MPLRDELPHRRGINPAGRQIVGPKHLDPGPLGEREVHQLVGGVVVSGGDDHVSRSEVEGRQRLRDGDRRVLDHGDVANPRTDERRDGLVDAGDLAGNGVFRLIPAEADLALDMAGHGLDHGPRHQRGPGVVEVDAVRGTWSVGPPTVEKVRRHRGRHLPIAYAAPFRGDAAPSISPVAGSKRTAVTSPLAQSPTVDTS